MDPNTHIDAADAISSVGALNTGLGVLTMTLFPFALPLLILVAVVALPLLLLAVPVALVISRR